MEEQHLMDISQVLIDNSLKKEERIKKFVEQIGNPYEFKLGDVEVAISFDADGEQLQSKMERYFETMIG